jgi:Reverse transcriptase (RNA-dependent DNA polymerase)
LLRPGGLRALTSALRAAKLDITAVQETRWPGKDSMTSSDYKFYYSGKTNDSPREYGTGFMVFGKARNAVIGFNPVDERLCTLRIRGKFFNYTLINVYAPTEEKDNESKELFYEKLVEVYDGAPKRDIKMVLGDFNAKIGREVYYQPTIGKFSLHENSNDNGTRVVDFAASRNMVVSSTRFEHKNIHKATWASPDGRTKNQIDHVLIDGRHCSNVLDVRSCRGPNVDSDHYLVRAVVRARISVQRDRQPAYEKWDVEKLQNEDIKRQYVDSLEAKIIDGMVSEQQSVADAWNQLRRNVESAAAETVGKRTGNKRNGWFDEECQRALDDKNAARLKTLNRHTRAGQAEYRSKRDFARKLFRRKKRQHDRNVLCEIEGCRNRKETRKFYRKVNESKNGYSQQPLLCRDKNGMVLADEERCIARWAEYYKELLNPNRPLNRTDENDELPFQTAQPYIEEPTIREVETEILKLRNFKAPGTDNLPGELFRNGGNALCMEMHELIKRIWNDEELPEEWKTSILCPIYKKGDKLECGNYRGIALLNIAYKIFANILYQRLLPYTESTIGEYQGSFRVGRSTSDQLFIIRQILEKCKEYNIETHHLFVDLEAAFDSVIRRKLWRVMEEFGIPNKLISLTKLTLIGANSRVRIRNQLSEIFNIEEGLRQGDPLATLLFNLTLEAAVRTTDIDPSGTIFTKSSQLLGFADDLDLIGRNMDAVKDKFMALEGKCSDLGLKVNDAKTEYMIIPPSNRHLEQNVTIGTHTFKMVNRFVYLGSELNANNDITDEIKRRITLGNRSYYSLLKILRSKSVSRNTKCVLYKTTIRPVVTYGSESWCLTQKDEQSLQTFERRVLRTIFGPVYDQRNERWRRRFNHELSQLYGEPDIVRITKINRLRWLGHVQRMDDKRIPKKILKAKPEGKRGAGRPKSRWYDAALANLRTVGVTSWETLAADRPSWRSMLEKAMTLNGL